MGTTQSTQSRTSTLEYNQDVYLDALNLDQVIDNYINVPLDSKFGTENLTRDINSFLHKVLGKEDEQRNNIMRNVVNTLSKQSAQIKTEMVIETNHPYDNSMDKTWEVNIPNATQLVLTFDSQCKSEQNYDYLQIYLNQERTQEYLQKWTGTDWPKAPIKCPHNKLFFFFHSDGSGNDWGFKCSITSVLDDVEDKGVIKEDVNVENLVVKTFFRTITILMNSMSKTDPTLRDLVLENFSDLLKKAKPGSMSTLPGLIDTSVSEMADYLQSLLKDCNPVQAVQILVLLVALSISRGSQQDFVKLLSQLEKVDELPILPFLRNWLSNKENVDSTLSFHAKSDSLVVSDVKVAWNKIETKNVISFCSNGSYLFILGTYGLIKVGTGLYFTERGNIYYHNKFAENIETSSYANFVDDRVLIVGKWSDKVQLGWFDVSSLKLLKTVDVLPENFGTTKIFCDSIKIYTIEITDPLENEVPKVAKFEIRIYTPVFDNDNWLLEPVLKTFNSEVYPTLIDEIWTNGNEISIFDITNNGTIYKISLEKLTCIKFVPPVEGLGLNTYIRNVFDVVNNTTWVAKTGDDPVFEAWPNPGFYRPQKQDFSLKMRTELLDLLNSIPADVVNISSRDARLIAFAILDYYVAPFCKVRYQSYVDPKTFSPRRPFIWDLDEDAFEVFYNFLEFYLVKPDSHAREAYQFLVGLRILKSNLQQMSQFNKKRR